MAENSVPLAVHKMVPKHTAETLVEGEFPCSAWIKQVADIPGPAPASYQPLITMLAALPEAEQRLFAASNPMASIIKGKTRIAEERLRMEKEATAYLLTRISELQTLLTEAKQVNANKLRDFGMFTKIELRNLMTSHGPAKEIIAELVARGVSEKALERSRGLNNEDMYKLFCEHPDVGEQFERYCKEALVAYKLLCKDSYMQALREVEKDTKAWLGFQREDMLKAAGVIMDIDVDGLYDKEGLSPAARALQSPVMWATPDIPRDPAQAVESTRHAAEKARASLENVGKREMSRYMDKVCCSSLGYVRQTDS